MNIVAMVLAGGEGTRLYPLTADHAKPAVPFAGGYRLVDFVLSNLLNSRISTIYVLAQYKPDSLTKHISA
ncbi:MAG TPA: sugar phosphate nucleotidyltransferase, partial [Burkholderiales bacterium]|nr:sugar phosphate nucleotidyltransferase [Burkholderiales bacterium]